MFFYECFQLKLDAEILKIEYEIKKKKFSKFYCI